MEIKISMILRDEDLEALKRLDEYFSETIGVELNRTAIIRHCIIYRVRELSSDK